MSSMVVSCMLLVGIAGAQDATGPERVLRRFQEHVAAYLAVREKATAGLPAPALTRDPATLQQATDRIAHAIQTARRRARRGDVFTPDVVGQFRSVIAGALQREGISPTDVRAEVKEELAEGRASGRRPAIEVNARFAWGAGSAMPPEILAALPALPKALEYRLVNRDLLLVDADADLVVDLLPDAIHTR